ncbi:MAG TPA: error-prone DNA polymerase, partial [Thermoanaerobaculia bacterium]|nr:error-prone DNA polymerase [Thermoanaerobaculia bacterium]
MAVDDDPLFPDSPPSRSLRSADGSPHPGYLSAGARKEKLRLQRAGTSGSPGGSRGRRSAAPPYPELRAASSFSFLDASSLPEDLVARAVELELPAVALVDRAGVYGAPRFYKAAKEAGVRALVGAELALGAVMPEASRSLRRSAPRDDASPVIARARSARGDLDGTDGNHSTTARRRAEPSPVTGAAAPPRLTLLVESRAGYQQLCRLLTAAARDKPKGAASATWEEVAAHGAGLCCLTGGDEGPLARALADGGLDAARRQLEQLAALFPGRLWVELQRHRRRDEEHRNVALVELARRLRFPLVATNGVRYARRVDKSLHDVLACIREHTTLDAAGTLLAGERERHLKGAAEMATLFADQPAALAGARELAARLDFTLADLGYRFPDFPLPPGETPASYLRQLTWNGARARFRPLTARAQAQLQKELALIEKLDLAGYFLIVWDIVRFCCQERILVQGRGSAANSAVCYALGITAVDPVKMELLFERFLSEERGEWPDIDLDLPSGDQREKAIQYVYQRYGAEGGSGAAMTANVITYRDRSAGREVAKALGWSPEQVDRLAKQLGAWNLDRAHGDPRELAAEMAGAGFDPADPRVRRFAELWLRIQNLPRHLGQHSGGMVIAAGRLDEVVPLEPASMPGRVVVQWDKDDCADLGLIKVDLLGLGMLDAIEEAVPLVAAKEGIHLDLAQLPPDDPKVFGMLQQADTVGVFQVESRAQMASLPRNHPERFYDLVVQVAIIRPGPIVGGMVHPYFERRRGREDVVYPHPSLEPVLKRTLGVPLFQEQILRMAMVTAGFSGGEAEELRRAMGFKRSVERMEHIERRLREGMARNDIHGETQDAIVASIKSFALYGFPESHAASFALIAYVSAWLKAYHPTAFLIALLNAYPMGFYHPATLVTDARRHGVEVRPIDVNRSGWRCRWEEREESVTPERSRSLRCARDDNPPVIARSSATKRSRRHTDHVRGACRLGIKFVRGLRQKVVERIEAEQARGPFRHADDLVARCALHRDELATLAHVGALASLVSPDHRDGLTRRQALWQVALASRPAGELFAEDPERAGTSPAPTSEKAIAMAEEPSSGVGAGLAPARGPL